MIDNTHESMEWVRQQHIDAVKSDKNAMRAFKCHFDKFFTDLPMAAVPFIFERTINVQRYDFSEIEIGKSFLQKNTKHFELNEKKTDGRIKPESFATMRQGLGTILYPFLHTIEDRNDSSFTITTRTTYMDFWKRVCNGQGFDELNDTNKQLLSYDFSAENTELPLQTPTVSDNPQRCMIQIAEPGVPFNIPLVYGYHCGVCEHNHSRKAYQVECTNNIIKCDGWVPKEARDGMKRCVTPLKPADDMTTVKQVYYYQVNYYDEHRKNQSVQAISFKNYKPGKYECVLFNRANPGRPQLFHIIDVNKMMPAVFTLPAQREDENYLFTLQQAIDNYLSERARMKIHGLFPIKCALILQKMSAALGMELRNNVMVVGDPGTGKSVVVKYYATCLNGFMNLMTNGRSVSIAGLRGTRTTIVLLGREHKLTTVGHLGNFYSICIDEAGENKELVQNLKGFILEANYSYDMAGSSGANHERIAHVNITQNQNREYVGQYNGSIAKAYRNVLDTEKPEWTTANAPFDDLFQPLEYYAENPLLYRIVSEQRQKAAQDNRWWLDGSEDAVHQRFPFYFFLMRKKHCDEIEKAEEDQIARKPITENFELVAALHNDDLDTFFQSLNAYADSEHDSEAFIQLRKVLHEYGLGEASGRIKMFYKTVLKLSRIINRRREYAQMDFDLVRWFLEHIRQED